MAEQKEVKETKAPIWTGKNEKEVNDYLSKVEGIDWHYTVDGNKKSLYLVKGDLNKKINRLTEVTW